jgi:hypothetical protein
MGTRKTMFDIARKEGRICPQCKWIINKKDYAKGYRLCSNCTDINKGVNTKTGHRPYLDEPFDMTGEM